MPAPRSSSVWAQNADDGAKRTASWGQARPGTTGTELASPKRTTAQEGHRREAEDLDAGASRESVRQQRRASWSRS